MCPRCGATSVTDRSVNQYLISGGRVFIDPDPNNPDAANITTAPPASDTATHYTEYWFNDSQPMSKKPYRSAKHPDWMVWVADAYDEVPRHSGKGRTDRQNLSNVNRRQNQIFMLFGDQRVGGYTWDESVAPEARDPYHSYGSFWNWGVAYPPGF